MQFPALPTDNLYKFVALGFLFLFSLIVYVSLSTAARLYDDLAEEQMARSETQRKINAVLALPDSDSKNKRIAEIDWISMHVTPSRQRHIFDEKVDDFFGRNGILLMLVTGGISFVGFLLWYWKIQRYQDEILRLQILELRKTAVAGSLENS